MFEARIACDYVKVGTMPLFLGTVKTMGRGSKCHLAVSLVSRGSAAYFCGSRGNFTKGRRAPLYVYLSARMPAGAGKSAAPAAAMMSS